MTNLLEGRVRRAEGRQMLVEWGGELLRAPANGAAPGDRVTLGIRPEHVLLPPLDAVGEGTVHAVLDATLQEGLDRRVTLRTRTGAALEMLLSERIFHRYDLALGRSVAVRLEPHHLWPVAPAAGGPAAES